MLLWSADLMLIGTKLDSVKIIRFHVRYLLFFSNFISGKPSETGKGLPQISSVSEQQGHQ